jgi:hypothetical protein
MATSIKISQLPAKGANLEATDLLEVSEFNGTGYVSKSITGQEIIDASAGGGGVTDITVNAPLSTTGGTTPDLAISEADASTDGFITAIDWNTFNDKQDALISGTNIKTINGSSVLGSGDLVVSGGGGGGIHALLNAGSGNVVSYNLTTAGFASSVQVINRMILSPFIPAKSFTSSNLLIRVFASVALSSAKILIYSDLNGKPDTLLYESTNVDCSTTGTKTVTTSFNFTAGTIYWLGFWGNSTPQIFTIAPANMMSLRNQGATPNPSNAVNVTVAYGSAPITLTGTTETIVNMPFIGITQS